MQATHNAGAAQGKQPKTPSRTAPKRPTATVTRTSTPAEVLEIDFVFWYRRCPTMLFILVVHVYTLPEILQKQISHSFGEATGF